MPNKMLALSLMMLAMTGQSTNQGRQFDLTDDDPVKKPIPKGAKEYRFYGVTVIAINEKYARKKAKIKAGII